MSSLHYMAQREACHRHNVTVTNIHLKLYICNLHFLDRVSKVIMEEVNRHVAKIIPNIKFWSCKELYRN